MCGRTACALSGPGLQKALCYKPDKSQKFVKPEWKDNSKIEDYSPSCNISPGCRTPVLLSGKHFGLKSERILQPMLWGILPHWAKDESLLNKYCTNNCRFDSLLKSSFFKKQFLNGQRCIAVCDGFYKWHSKHEYTRKQPYFIYMPQPKGVKIEDETTWNTEFDSDKGWNGPNLVKMAAIFDKWNSQEGKEIFSYSIITLESNGGFSSIHHRIPAILDSEELVTKWLDFESFPETSALSLLKETERLLWHPVSTKVNHSENQFKGLKKPIQKKKNQDAFLLPWFKRSSVPKKSSDCSKGKSFAAKVKKPPKPSKTLI